ncbi:MAG: single-stranded-DNA-specific exonuclease RecJ, partial [Pseudomonadota bacterium]|nr:single-stranded-DNA-specific exonuclease RecJ [Pseudomonadota bacterium]
MNYALGVERSVAGQPWRWRRSGEPGVGLEQLVDELLRARGVAADDLARHRDPRIRDFLPDPSAFQDMDKCARRLADAIEREESIAIFGDYDVDGATSAALLTLLFRRLGADPTVYIPDRLMEGYGPSGAALVELKARGATLAVTVDCGAQAFEALEQAKAANLDVIVVDHHQCATLLPVAFAVINPNRLDEAEIGASHGHLAAVGMAFLVGVAVLRELRARGFFADTRPEPKILDLLDLVALGTVADVAKLHGLNRAFVTQGLKIMAARQNVGLAALAEAARLVKDPSCRDLGWALGPRINAGGRVGKSDLGVRLLTSDDPEEARQIAAELDRLNEERRAIETQVCEAAEAQAREQDRAPVITVMGGGWHPGVIGIVAGRIKERFGRPAIVIAECEDGTGKGSGRSISGVDLGAAVLAAKESGLLIAGGGHAMAAGLTLPAGGLEPFREFINQRLAADIEAAIGARALLLDALLSPGGIVASLCDALDGGGPYGAGWPSPRIAAGPCRLLKL